MRITVDYEEEFESEMQQEIDFIKEEFALIFGDRATFTPKDRDLAFAILSQLSKRLEQTYSLEHFPQTLTDLERQYPQLFELSR
jgi:hypothetical protein